MDTGLYRCSNPRTIYTNVPITNETLSILRRTASAVDEYGNVIYRPRKTEVYKMSARCPIVVPCGECFACRLSVQRQWQARITTEFSTKTNPCFFATFTISPDFYPECMNTKTAKNMYSYMVRERLIPNLRAPRVGNMKFTYYAAAEFGDNHGRLHFHIIFFPDSMFDDKWKNQGKPVLLHYRPKDTTKKPKKSPRMQDQLEADFQNLLQHIWKYGFVEKVERADYGSAAYVTKYVTKIKEDKEYDKCPFHRQSIGIGTQWLSSHKEEIAKGVYNKMPCDNTGNSKYHTVIPKYYKKKYQKEFGTYIDHSRYYVKNAYRICKSALNQPKVIINGVPVPETLHLYINVPNSIGSYDSFDAIIPNEIYECDEFDYITEHIENYRVKQLNNLWNIISSNLLATSSYIPDSSNK